MAKVLTERMAFSGVTVGGTAEAPVVEGVLACGPVSANRRRYLVQAFAGDRIKRYNDVPVGTYHTDPKTGRKYLEQIGMTRNARHRADGMPLIDIAVNPEKPGAKAFLWDARHQPNACSMSHVAHCETTRAADGWEDVTELVRVESVDIIAAGDAATTTSLLENRNRRTAVGLSVKQLCEALVKHPKVKAAQVKPLKILAEMDGMDGAMTSTDAPPADADEPGDGVKDAFCTAIMAVVNRALDGEEDAKEALRKIKEMIASHDKVKGGKSEPDEEEEEEEEEEAYESKGKGKKHKAADPIAVYAECKAAGFEPKPGFLKYLCTLSEADRKEQITEAVTESKTGQKPSAPSRRPGAGQAGAVRVEQNQQQHQAPKIPKFDEM